MGAEGAAAVAWHDRPIRECVPGREVQALESLTPEEFALFVDAGTFRRVRAGEVLFQRGEPGTAMYVVVQGVIGLDFGDGRAAKRLGSARFFGELGLLIDGHARSASARAPFDGTLLELQRDAYERLVQREPGMVCQFLRRAIMRVMLGEPVLGHLPHRSQRSLDAALDRLRDTANQLQHAEVLIRTDALTGLANRRGLVRHLVDRRRSGATAPLGLLLLNCDGFSRINDRHGPLAGDRVLQGVASLLRAVSAPGDVACRLGGDDFALLVQATTRDEVMRIADFALDTARGLQGMAHDLPVICNFSIGACLIPSSTDVNDWYAGADAALYRAKRRGGNRVEWQDTRTAP